MSTTIESKTATATKVAPRTKTTRRSTPAQPAPQPEPISTDEAVELLSKRPLSEVTRMIFMGLLGVAACIAVAGVLTEADGPGTSPDDSAPTVIVELTD